MFTFHRSEFMRQFLLYGHVLSTEEAELYADYELKKNPPTLDNFKEQVCVTPGSHWAQKHCEWLRKGRHFYFSGHINRLCHSNQTQVPRMAAIGVHLAAIILASGLFCARAIMSPGRKSNKEKTRNPGNFYNKTIFKINCHRQP